MSQRRITHIEIKDYRAFYGTHQISLEKGENLLVFGENGSGKTSLYRAVLAFLQSTATAQPVSAAVNIWQSSGTAPDIRLCFAEFDATGKKVAASEESFPANDAAFPDYVKKANLSKGFFSYRELLKTHLIDSEEHTSFFELFMEVILADFVYPGSGRLLREEWADINHLGSNYAKTLNPADDPTPRFAEFNQQLQASLDLITLEMNEVIQYFNQGISIELTRTDAELSVKTGSSVVKIPSIDIEVSLFDRPIPEHYNFLNEARLSALSLSIYLAALKTNPTSSECKILFLDDTFIGLDMGNRLPLLSVLNDKFADYQIFITTYDRAWFELAGTYLQGNWKGVEMYTKAEILMEHINGSRYAVGSVEHPPGSREIQFENPLIIDPSLNLFKKAELYFYNKDYPAAGNALRKECEKLLKNYLPEGYLLSSSGEGLMLGNLLLKLTEYFEEARQTIPPDLLSEIIFFKKALFNPASHHDLRSNLYRGEIERSFITVEKLRSLSRISWTPILHPGQELAYEYPTSNFKLRILVGDYIYRTKFGPDVSVSKLRFYTNWWEKDGVEYQDRKSGTRHSDVEIAKMTTQPYNEIEIVNWIKRHTGQATELNYLQEFKTSVDTLENLLK